MPEEVALRIIAEERARILKSQPNNKARSQLLSFLDRLVRRIKEAT